MVLQIGDIVVTKTDVPRRFLNVKPGTLWKVVGLRGPGKITVGDAQHPTIKTHDRFFLVLNDFAKDQIQMSGNTDLAVRLKAVEAFQPRLKSASAFNGYVKVKANKVPLYFERGLAKALAARNSDKLVQRRLVETLGGL